MSEKEIQIIESRLMEFTKNRLNLSGIAGSILRSIGGNILQSLHQRMIQAFSRAILSVQKAIYLHDLATAVISEVGYMMDVRPIKVTGRMITDSDTFYLWQTELHAWLIFLSSERLLPGRYERFIGRYVVD